MSKSRGNIINLFLPEKELKKQVNSIVTDSTPLEEPKNPDTCNAYQIYTLMSKPEEVAVMRKNYENGGWGFGHTKKAILEYILNEFSEERARFTYFMENTNELDALLEKGAEKARVVANEVLARVRAKIGY